MPVKVTEVKSVLPLTPLQELQLGDVTMGVKIKDFAKTNNANIVCTNVVEFKAQFPNDVKIITYYSAFDMSGEIYYTSSPICGEDLKTIFTSAIEKDCTIVGINFISIPNRKPDQADTLKARIKGMFENEQQAQRWLDIISQ